MIENKKIKNGLKKAAIAMTLAFTGPILFVIGFGHEKANTLQILVSIIGGLLMLGCLIIGFLAIKDMLAGFFEQTNE